MEAPDKSLNGKMVMIKLTAKRACAAGCDKLGAALHVTQLFEMHAINRQDSVRDRMKYTYYTPRTHYHLQLATKCLTLVVSASPGTFWLFVARQSAWPSWVSSLDLYHLVERKKKVLE